MLEVTQISTTTTKAAPKRRRELLTQADIAALLRFDQVAGELHWLKAPKGKRPDQTRAGCAISRKGKPAGRVVTINGQRWRESHIVTLLQTGELPAACRRSKSSAKGTRKSAKASTPRAIETPIAASTVAAPAPVQVPRDLPELSRAVIAAAPKHHRGFLAGLARHVFTR